MKCKTDFELNDSIYHIAVDVQSEGVHLHDLGDQEEIYLSDDHFDKIAKALGYVKID